MDLKIKPKSRSFFIYQSSSSSSSLAATLFFLLLKAPARASARDSGWPRAAPPPDDDGGGCSPFASASKAEGFSSCDLSVFLSELIPPAPLMEDNKASLPESTVGKGGVGPEELKSGGGGGGGGAPPDGAVF